MKCLLLFVMSIGFSVLVSDARAADTDAELKEKLVGTWILANPAPKQRGVPWQLEFPKDGKMTYNDTLKVPFKVQDKKIIMIAPSGGSDGTFEIKTLTETKLVIRYVGKGTPIPEKEQFEQELKRK